MADNTNERELLERLEKAENVLELVKRYVWGVVCLLMTTDEIIARAMKQSQKKNENVTGTNIMNKK